ncbi:MAG TPA: double-strand break repair protein AddB [Dongiaceae bacterium]|nr:double-strand break repair protein AddB [Dongiaceae bacterium]
MSKAPLRKKPNVLSIPTGISFAEALAAELLRVADHDPLKLAEMIVLLPNRRACRTLQEAFLRAAISPERIGGASLLPRLMPIGDLDGDDLAVLSGAVLGAASAAIPPAIGELKRRMLLARLIMAAPRRAGPSSESIRLDQAVQLAQELARLLDQVETERKDFAALDGLVPDNLAQHWQLTVNFLDILRRAWPGILADEGAIDPAERRNQLLDLQARIWTAAPPKTPIIAAGSTGSIPAAADLMAVVARLPAGTIYLPGLDRAPRDADWTAIEADPTHPQHGLALLLQRLELKRDDVPDISTDIAADQKARARIVSAALLPAERSDRWNDLADGMDSQDVASAMRAVRRIDCQTEQEEALTIAIALRGFLAEQPDGTAALATPDRRLARRVAAQLRRWRIEIDDSAGQELSQTAPGSFLLLLAEAAASDWAPVPLLGLLKHPLAAAGQPLGQLRRFARHLDHDLLRGPRPAPGWDGLAQAIELRQARKELRAAAARILTAGLPDLRFATASLAKWGGKLPPVARLHALIVAAEALAATDTESGRERLWRGEAGEALADFTHDALASFAGIGPVAAVDFSALLMELLSGVAVRPRFGKHPRLYIWGPLEARLQQPDLLILGGMNEGTWPAESAIDPWLNRPMRKGFGLPLPERKIGLAAHDFQQAMGAKRVLLTRAARAEGAPTVPSRWLLRLDAFLKCCGDEMALKTPPHERNWARQLDLPVGPATPCARPAPRPGAAHRPARMSVTQIELWRRNPYAIYARHILDLQALDELDQDPGAADLGSAVHDALHDFVTKFPRELPPSALAELTAIGEEAFQDWLDRPNVWAFWQPRFRRIAAWWLAQEEERRPALAQISTELRGEWAMNEVSPAFTLTARADRIDRFRDGSLAILDYKTGAPPKDDEVALGFAPQLTLEAAMAERGAFTGIAAAPVTELAHWRLSGSGEGGEEKPIKGDLADLARAAYDGLVHLLAHYSADNAAYPASPDPLFAPRYDDYTHLARNAEWSSDLGSEP